MLFSTHVLTGAVIGRLLPAPAGFVAGCASHFGFDSVPHWGGVDDDDFMKVARIDGLAALAIGGWVLARTPKGSRMRVAAGIAGACLPDLDKPLDHFFGVNPFAGPVQDFHVRIQQGKEAPRNLWSDLVTAAVAAEVLASWRRQTQRVSKA